MPKIPDMALRDLKVNNPITFIINRKIQFSAEEKITCPFLIPKIYVIMQTQILLRIP